MPSPGKPETPRGEQNYGFAGHNTEALFYPMANPSNKKKRRRRRVDQGCLKRVYFVASGVSRIIILRRAREKPRKTREFMPTHVGCYDMIDKLDAAQRIAKRASCFFRSGRDAPWAKVGA
jgi:hypothetical protein